MSAAIVAFLAVIGQIASSLGVGQIGSIIGLLEQVIPLLIKEATDVVPLVQNIINALKSNTAITQDQLDALQVLETKYDADFEAAATAAQAEDTPPA